MKLRQGITGIALLALVVATIVGLFMTNGGPAVLPTRNAKKAVQSAPAVDQESLDTAHKLAALATSPDEQEFARQALRLADYEVDLAFADALREATQHPPTPTAEQRELMARNAKAEATVKSDQEQVTHLTHQLAAAKEEDKEAVQDQLDVTKAQQELDQDELDDAKEECCAPEGIRRGRSSCFCRSTRPGLTPVRALLLTQPPSPMPSTSRITWHRRLAPGWCSGRRAFCWLGLARMPSTTFPP